MAVVFGMHALRQQPVLPVLFANNFNLNYLVPPYRLKYVFSTNFYHQISTFDRHIDRHGDLLRSTAIVDDEGAEKSSLLLPHTISTVLLIHL
jgi:hypothetical protein